MSGNASALSFNMMYEKKNSNPSSTLRVVHAWVANPTTRRRRSPLSLSSPLSENCAASRDGGSGAEPWRRLAFSVTKVAWRMDQWEDGAAYRLATDSMLLRPDPVFPQVDLLPLNQIWLELLARWSINGGSPTRVPAWKAMMASDGGMPRRLVLRRSARTTTVEAYSGDGGGPCLSSRTAARLANGGDDGASPWVHGDAQGLCFLRVWWWCGTYDVVYFSFFPRV